MSALRGARKPHFIAADAAAPAKTIKEKDSKDVPNPEYDLWVTQDQQVLNYLLSSVSRDILAQIATLLTSAEAWAVIESMFASQSRARVINTRMSLATAQKGSSTIAEYFGKLRTLANEMASAGQRLDDEVLASYILAGLDVEFNN
jgi:hypothetical protein